ncbi:hypothetical protein [Aneurinibacillus thermoaerophilus]|uniref:hypothetical protein n=1 Tax=Aneurinibacillus thermoaerophilus TaxID=143495 RepID=UPI002E212C8D|nr:hypothetical protein [Aneurinibacillus thermoaerophilus]
MVFTKKHELIKYLFIFFSIVCLTLSLTVSPRITGDGREYLGMVISITNHFTPNLTDEDLSERESVERENHITFPQGEDYAGYFKDLNDDYYSYHFWFYSLVCSIPYFFLDIFDLNPLKTFQLTNTLLLLLLIWWILYRTSFNYRTKLWLLISVILSPVCFYISWSHPEVFSFVFLFIGLLEFLEKRFILAVILTSIASFQNPGIAVVSAYIVLYQLFSVKRVTYSAICTMLSSLLVFIPYVFYWIHYHQFSLISSTGFASLRLISLNKILSLFFDLNFGLIIYVPVLLLTLIWLALKLDRVAISGLILLLLIAIICSTQANWNSGMMYINRYSVWMIPIIIVSILRFIISLDRRKFIKYVMIFTLTTGVVSFYCMYEQDYQNYLKFGPVTKLILSNFPSLYNPPYEVFVERALGEEEEFKDKIPLTLWNISGPRKTLMIDSKTGQMKYINDDLKINRNTDLFVMKKFEEGKDIFEQDEQGAFIRGWHSLEQDDKGNKFRWTDKEAQLLIHSTQDHPTKIKMEISSFYSPRHCIIYLNDKVVFSGVIDVKSQSIEIKGNFVPGLNVLRIQSREGAQSPKSIPELKSSDARSLAFNIQHVLF